ncbi:MAG: MFS transporter [Rhodovibrionaceae bacterium]
MNQEKQQPERRLPEPPEQTRLSIAAWCFFDWANSAFPTVIITFIFAAYYTQALAPTKETGTSEWAWAMSISGLAIAVLAPVLGALADQGGRRKPYIFMLSLVCVACGLLLWTIAPERSFALRALIVVGIANVAFEIGQVFYNAMLPEVAPPGKLGRVSGWAWALGYAGGLVCLTLSLLLLVQPDPSPLGLDRDAGEHVRATGPFVALWYLVFALPMFLLTPERAATGIRAGRAIRDGLASLWRTIKSLPEHRGMLRFLIARMIYIDGLNTLFAFGGIYAAGSFGMDFEEVLIFGILLNVTAGLGAFAFAWIDDWIGPKRTILISVAALTLLGAAILVVESKLMFYILGCGLGIFIGPTQSASRSLMARLAPPAIRTELFGLYAFSGRVTAFLGPFLVGLVTYWSDSQRLGMSVILVLFLIGLVLLWPLREPPQEQPGP